MNVKALTAITRSSIEHTSQLVKSKLNTLLQKPSLSIEDLSSFITSHPATAYQKKDYLNLLFHFYHLTFDNLIFTLEKSGKTGNHILELHIYSIHEPIISYHSYERIHSPNEALKLPKTLLAAIQHNVTDIFKQ